jgi:glyoxylase-like metal-dependent hydrolase (beta-lactamase superfamily II)
MTHTRLLVLLMAGLFAACSQATPEQQIVNDAAEALGGADRIRAVKTFVVEGDGTQYNLGQDVTPEASGQTFTVTDARYAVDVAGGRTRFEFTRRPNFTYFQGPQAQRLVQGLDGVVAYNVAASGTATRAPEAVATERRMGLYHHPITAVRAALDPMAKVSNAHTMDGQSMVDVTTADGISFMLAIDPTTKLPTRVISRADNTNLGDVAMEARFADYQDVGGVQMPTRFTMRIDDFTTAEYRAARQAVDGDTGDLAAPAETAKATPPPPPTVAVEELARGIWYLAGGSHHSVLVEFADHMTLIEAPQSDARSLAVIARAREVNPKKPLTELVNSHHHFDHSGGIRAAIAEGLTIITHQGNVALFENMAKRPHTVVPDALAKSPKPAMIKGIGQDTTLSDGMMTMQLLPYSGPHTETMLMAYFPRERILVEADVYNPGGQVFMFAGHLLEELKRRNLRIDRIVPLHAKVAPWAQFVKEASMPVPTAATN